MRAALAAVLCAACRIPNEQFPVTDAPTGDVAIDGTATCDVSLPFNAAVPITELADTLLSQGTPRLTHDELVIYYWVRAAGTLTGGDLITASRSTPGGTFGSPSHLMIDQSTTVERDPSVIGDNGTLYFATDRATPGTNKVWVASRPNTTVDFSSPTAVAVLDTGMGDDVIQPYVMADDQQLYVAIQVAGTTMHQIYASRRVGGAYVKPYKSAFANVDDLTTENQNPVVTPDLLTLYFESPRPGGQGGPDIWKATRTQPANGFGAPVNVTELNTAESEYPGWISDDGCRLYFARGAMNTQQLYVASKPAM